MDFTFGKIASPMNSGYVVTIAKQNITRQRRKLNEKRASSFHIDKVISTTK